jgi:hypothetical protein
MNSLKPNSDRPHPSSEISKPSQWLMSRTNKAIRDVIDISELNVSELKSTRRIEDTTTLENKLKKLYADCRDTLENQSHGHKLHATGDIHHSQFGSFEGKNKVSPESPESIITSQFRIIQEQNTIIVPKKLYIWEILRAKTSLEMEARLKWVYSSEAYANSFNTTDYPKWVTSPVAWDVTSYTLARGTIILHLSRPSTLQNNQNRLLKLSIGESEFGTNSSAFFIEKEQYVSWIKFDPNTGRTTTGGLVIMGHSASNNSHGSGVQRISLAPTENKTPKEGFGSLAKKALMSLIGGKA